MALGKSEE